ncbi:MAG: hypothetical protein ACYC36_14990 [Bellilinea sp.]
MSEETVIDGQAHDPQAASTGSATGASTGSATAAANDASAGPATSGAKAPQASGSTLKGAWKQVENIGQTLGEALQGRGNVVMVRVNDDTLAHLDMLVEAELARSRSEAAALLIGEGMKANLPLFERIRQITDQIAALRGQLRQSVQDEESVDQKTEGAE